MKQLVKLYYKHKLYDKMMQSYRHVENKCFRWVCLGLSDSKGVLLDGSAEPCILEHLILSLTCQCSTAV